MLSLRDIEYFLAVVEHASVARAAEACHVSQPTLSMQLKKLEEQLGVALFERLPRAMRPTEAGLLLLPQARALRNAATTLESQARSMADPLAGTLRIGVFPTLAPYLLPVAAQSLAERLPRLAPQWIEEKTPTLVKQLQEGAIDAALLAMPVEGPGLVARFLFDEPFLLAVSAKHPLARSRKPVSLEALREEEVLLLEEGHCLRDQALSLCQRIGVGETRAFRATSLETLRQMVRVSDIVTLMPLLAASADHGGGLIYRPFTKPAPGRQIALVMRGSDPRGKLMQALENVWKDTFQQLLKTSSFPEFSKGKL